MNEYGTFIRPDLIGHVGLKFYSILFYFIKNYVVSPMRGTDWLPMCGQATYA